MNSVKNSRKWVFLLFFLSITLNGCAEIKKIISVFADRQTSLNTTAFNVLEMSSGDGVTCSIMGDKSVRCLGSNVNGSIGRFYGAPNNLLKEIKQIALGKGFTCAIVGENSAVKCFGTNDKGQLGNNILNASSDPVSVLDAENNDQPIVDAKQIAAGENHACALLKNGRALCWGDNSFGQIGNPSQAGIQVKTILESEKIAKPFQGIQSIYAGGNSTCIVAKEDLSLFCFGERFGSTKKNNWVPEKIELAGGADTLSQVKQVGLGNNFGCALARSQVFCWGNNEYKQLGTTTNTSAVTKAVSVEVHYPLKAPLTKIESITVGDKHACALHRDEGTVYCWGNNSFGQLGNTSIRGLPEQVAVGSNNLTLKGVKYVAAGRERSCIISSGDELFCWGNGAHGILGNENRLAPYPTKVIDSNNEFLNSSASVMIGYDHACVISMSKKLFCFGLNPFGQFGSRMIGSSTLNNVTSIDTDGQKTCVVHGEKKEVGCFGGKDLSSVTEDEQTNSFSLEEVKNNLKPYRDSTGISVGKNHVCIINSEAQVECIDYATKPANHYLVLNEKKSPLKDIWLVRSRGLWNCGITREKGELWCWGDWKKNQWPQAKQLTFASKPTTDFIQFSLNEDQICGIHGVSGIVYCTPDSETQNNTDLQLIADSGGKQLTGVFTLSGGKHHTCALNDRNQLFCWGSNEFGQLGVSTTKNSPVPMNVSIKDESKRKISRVSAGDTHTCFTTGSELALFCFGKSPFGEGISTNPVEYPL